MTVVLIVLLLIVIGAAAAIGIFWFSSYNRLVKYRMWAEESWAQIDNMLKQRYDMIPNLVNTVKGYAKHEQETLTQVIEKRNQMQDSNVSRNEQMHANNEAEQMLGRLFALREDYPDLKANENFMHLQQELTSMERKLAYARQTYNSTVRDYNIAVQSIPTNFVANVHNFLQYEMLETPEEERENVKVEF
ncbi:LemA family protein [Geomicrobium sp. JCM 19055]|uniref:LemA family protein n=1 Tax=Geomicrobium sp. JCM 19055 TaxID=1460649 RepID=UPI00045ED944|nr:LemA family protein [Geomicrobium sp. JCM 19055]GAJ98002.1 LemA protein [Geomicrobium sp. JCM 19055]